MYIYIYIYICICEYKLHMYTCVHVYKCMLIQTQTHVDLKKRIRAIYDVIDDDQEGSISYLKWQVSLSLPLSLSVSLSPSLSLILSPPPLPSLLSRARSLFCGRSALFCGAHLCYYDFVMMNIEHNFERNMPNE